MSASPEDQARRFVDELVANGAAFTFRPADISLPATFTYALGRGGDHWRCRGLILDAKADPAIWRELVAEIDRRSVGGAA